MRGTNGSVLARVVVVLLLVGTALVGCSASRDAVHVSIEALPTAGMFDAPVTVTVRGLPVGARTTVTASATDAAGVEWSASAEFQAGPDGVLSLGSAPLTGSYPGANPMGLFQFMAPVRADLDHIVFVQPDSGSYDVTLTTTLDGSTVATTRVTRQSPAAAGVTSRELTVAADGVFGSLFLPGDTSVKRSAVLVFGGSIGGLHPVLLQQAALSAAHGHPSLALAYFHGPGLPETLTAIPLEYFTTALAVLRAQPGVDPQRIFVRGASYGGEAALLLGSYFPDLVNGVIAEVPNSYVDASYAMPDRSAWSVGGRELPHATRQQFGAPAVSVDPSALIPVERIRGPVLLSCGEQDAQWPSCNNVEDITARLSKSQFGYPVTTLRYPDGGHYLSSFPPYTSFTAGALSYGGGTVAGTQAANVDVHAKVLALLDRS
jgi:pimeloyl-ACP methyl ester carboxylesterase